MTDRELEQRIAQAISRSAPNDPAGVLSRCETRKGTVIPMTNQPKTRKLWKNWIAACLALVLVGGGGGLVYQQSFAVASVVSLDVNPSVELSVNKREKVLTCVPLNEEAQLVLADMGEGADLRGTKLDVAVNAIVGALVREGYLSSISSAILISVEDEDQTRAAQLRQELTQTVDDLLQDQSAQADVLSQTVNKDAALEQQAKDYNITTGKAALVNRVLALNEKLDFEALAQLSVEELRDLAEVGAPGMPIGTRAAYEAARKYAGLTEVDVRRWESDPELDDRTAHYEVELEGTFGEYDYMVEAYTGKVLQGKADLLAKPDPAPVQPTTPVTPAVTDIGADKAKAAALKHAGVKESHVTGMKVEQDRDDGRLEYEIEFWYDSTEYDYTILASDGTVLKYESSRESKPAATPATPTTSAVTDIGADKAEEIALAHAGLNKSQVVGLAVKPDRNDGRLEYEVEFWNDDTEYDYTILASDGTILKYDTEREEKPVVAPTQPTTSEDIGSDGAKAAALAHAGCKASQVTGLKVERDRDDGRLEYDVEFCWDGTEYEYTIDGCTGGVLEHETDHCDEGSHSHNHHDDH